MSREERTETREGKGRKSRTPLGRVRLKMSAPQRKGYARRWMNDEGNRLADAVAGGWNFVEDAKNVHVGESAESASTDIGSRMSMTVGVQESGSPLVAYFMEIKDSHYKEDFAAKQREVDKVDAAIKGGAVARSDKQYVPKGGIKYES